MDKVEKIQRWVNHGLRLTLAVAIALGVYEMRWSLVFATSLILLATYLPYMFERRYNIQLPTEFEFIIIVFIFASLFLGEIQSYYARFAWWDIILHISSGIALGFVGFLILYVLYHKNAIKAAPGWIAVFAFCFGLAAGAVWEVFEFAMDTFFGLNMQKSGLVDTMWDLIVDALGALLTSFVGYFYIRGKQTPLFTRLLHRFRQENPKMFK